MSVLKNKIDFVVIVNVENANPNGDPLNGNCPRTDYDGYGEISDVCIKRKLRNRMQDLDNNIFVQSASNCKDGFPSLRARAEDAFKEVTAKEKDAICAKIACEKWMDVRSFGQVFAYSDKKDKADKESKGSNGVSIGIRGPVSIHLATSIAPVEITSMQITKSVNDETSDKKNSSTMGMKHFIRHGVYKIKGSINVQLAEKTGFTDEDAEALKECFRTLFVNDTSAARPDGSISVVKVYWFKHNCKEGQYSSAKVHESVNIAVKEQESGFEEGECSPKNLNDYNISLTELPGLDVEVIEGI